MSEWKSSSESLTLARFPCFVISASGITKPTIQRGTDRPISQARGRHAIAKYILGRKL
jgi:hypothetical protein